MEPEIDLGIGVLTSSPGRSLLHGAVPSLASGASGAGRGPGTPYQTYCCSIPVSRTAHAPRRHAQKDCFQVCSPATARVLAVAERWLRAADPPPDYIYSTMADPVPALGKGTRSMPQRETSMRSSVALSLAQAAIGQRTPLHSTPGERCPTAPLTFSENLSNEIIRRKHLPEQG
jgi:hypothetical protein